MFNNKKFLITNLIFFALILIADVCFLTIDCSAYITKTIASALFVICGLVNLIMFYKLVSNTKDKIFMITMVIALTFAMLGDIFLIDYFVLGAILFAIGHIGFITAFCVLSKPNWKDLVIGIGIFLVILALILFVPAFDFNGMKMLVIIYALVISLMLGKAISNTFVNINKTLKYAILLGASLFFISDFMLMLYLFLSPIKIFDIICLLTYYPAEIILAGVVGIVAICRVEESNSNKTNK